MPKFSANLSFLFTDVPFLDRFEAAANAGFSAVEYLFPYEFPAEEIKRRLDRHGLQQVLFNISAGSWDGGERGTAAVPGREAHFASALDEAIRFALVLGCPRIHAMAGCPAPGGNRSRLEATYLRNLALASRRAAEHGIDVLIEPLNHRDVPGYFLNTTAQAVAVLDRLDAPNVKLQLDLYHVQVTEGDLANTVRAQFGRYGHVQIAGNPGRNEPDVGEIRYPHLFGLLDELGYDGWIGCEYRPLAGTLAGLGWAAPYGISATKAAR
jgi:hydroxypyruvate isomerase